jgi:energy-coupling factor transporter ATP-binding protein EcfA2
LRDDEMMRSIGFHRPLQIEAHDPSSAQTAGADHEQPQPVAVSAAAPHDASQRRPPVLTLTGVTFQYQGGHDVVRGVNLEVRPGEPVAIVGAHGAGKTTLAKLIAGLLKPTSGSITVQGKNALALELAERLKHVALVLRDPDQSISERTVFDEIAFPLRGSGLDRSELRDVVADVGRRVGLDKELLDQDPTSLSVGMRKRVVIATALVRRPQLLLLDEPVEGLDGTGRERLIELLRRLTDEGVAVIVFDHHLDFLAQVVDRAVLMKDGAIIADAPVNALFSNSAISHHWHKASVPMPRAVQLGLGTAAVRHAGDVDQLTSGH